MKKRTFVALLCGLMFVVAAPALASSPSQSAYSGNGANQISSVSSAGTTSTSAKTLPFTGINLGALSIVGLGLIGTGFVLRRRSHPGTD